MKDKDKISVELPRLKDSSILDNTFIRDEIIVNDISDTYVIKTKNNVVLIIFLLGIVLLVIVVLFLGLKNKMMVAKENVVSAADIEIVNYNVGSDTVDIAIVPSSTQNYCAVSVDNENSEELEFQKIVNDKCYITVPLSEQYVYFKDSNDVVSDKLLVDDYVVYIDVDEKQYVPLEEEHNLYNSIVVVGEPVVNWVTLGDVVQVNEESYTSKKVGNTKIQAVVNNKVVANMDVVVTDVIVSRPKTFNNDKEFLSCAVYTHEEAMLLDEILAFRIEEVGYGTRAAAVEAARFLTLEFPYRISYYWESGRLNNTGRHYVDGEGRYYHKGLYLDESKYDSIEASLFGPAMWGCKLMSYEDDPPNFVPGVKYPNGLDCSGFVTWALFNGGFDVGDRGAGESPSEGQLTDLGEFKLLTNELINSGKIKVGDLFNFWGHIAILIGQDEDNYYIAESLNNYKGVVVKTYSKKKVRNTFKYVVLMDSVYNGDGNLTDMWY